MTRRLPPVSLYLDDVRPNPYPGWVAVRSAEEAFGYLLTREVEHASLDHDLGACDQCKANLTRVQSLTEQISELEYAIDQKRNRDRVEQLTQERADLVEQLKIAEGYHLGMVRCVHTATGYDLVTWMVERDVWPTKSITVHSANPSGAAAMRWLIQKHWNDPKGILR